MDGSASGTGAVTPPTTVTASIFRLLRRNRLGIAWIFVLIMVILMLLLTLRGVFGKITKFGLRVCLSISFFFLVFVLSISVKLCFNDDESSQEEESERAQELEPVPARGAAARHGRGSRRSQRRILNEFLSSATQATIDRLPMYIFQGTKQREKSEPDEEAGEAGASFECSICITEVDPGDKMRILPCLHQFHSECVDQWLLANAKCPTCKYSIL
uniref:RING-type domain-containing protein n=1 Tax=Rhodosorus marinus TaxID=101924 RepID=A0A7S2ZEQ5_9RHOD|mmetsp:Transcript_16954/g.69187  ORF Transcript_16954/g.69187 Transcript_16954/m.69187 type:complete len:215 (+) Transcript_16954:311-955(+)|eukprot:CAMPEP_0113957468 /NCGR_PEP_ID=MMETSP0011_2-20120614/2798_1 /TAXON_ID=101924 /ORGANISM="Rhodosorus marinus" /LENGTH=214 /DNA_ID=CAMNT_0000968057 /DNA_START=250 /DNA_END=894 /DNA_ORIENTATION=+ /assembly_acc=CAM_ASM_000156